MTKVKLTEVKWMFCKIKSAEICFEYEEIAKDTLKDLEKCREYCSHTSTEEILDALIDAIENKVGKDDNICVKIGDC